MAAEEGQDIFATKRKERRSALDSKDNATGVKPSKSSSSSSSAKKPTVEDITRPLRRLLELPIRHMQLYQEPLKVLWPVARRLNHCARLTPARECCISFVPCRLYCALRQQVAATILIVRSLHTIASGTTYSMSPPVCVSAVLVATAKLSELAKYLYDLDKQQEKKREYDIIEGRVLSGVRCCCIGIITNDISSQPFVTEPCACCFS